MPDRPAPRPGGARSAQPPSRRSRVADPARLATYLVSRSVADGGYANIELPNALRRKHIRGRDAAFATELTYGTIRLRGRYDPILALAAQRDLAAIDAPVLDVLRLGAHQLLGMRVPPHAATAETVALARQVVGAGAAGFVNAVLRRVGDRDLDDWLDVVAPVAPDPLSSLAIRESHPPWIVAALRAALVGDAAGPPADADEELTALLAADNTPAKVTLVARPGLIDPQELLSQLPGERTSWAPTGVVLRHGDPGLVPAVRDGRAAVQDEGSQLVAWALAAAPIESARPGDEPEHWADLCAGPGGKAGILAALAVDRGARLLASDVSEHRVALTRSSLRAVQALAAPGQVTVAVADGRDAGAVYPRRFDRVLLDAPCTGLGVLRRRPEARWRRTPEDLPVLARLQRDLLGSALEATRPGGVVGYATCSPHLSETRFAVADVVRRRDDVEVLDAPVVLAQLVATPIPDLGPGPYLQLWPHRHDTDGMFLALLRRRV